MVSKYYIQSHFQGKWRKEPPQFLTPQQYIEFGSESTGTHSGFGIEGHVTYKYIEGENKNSLMRSYNFIKVTWANKMGNSHYAGSFQFLFQ